MSSLLLDATVGQLYRDRSADVHSLRYLGGHDKRVLDHNVIARSLVDDLRRRYFDHGIPLSRGLTFDGITLVARERFFARALVRSSLVEHQLADRGGDSDPATAPILDGNVEDKRLPQAKPSFRNGNV